MPLTQAKSRARNYVSKVSEVYTTMIAKSWLKKNCRFARNRFA